MTDRILEIGSAGLESSEQRVRKLMDNMVGAEIPAFKKSEVVIRGFPLELDAAEQSLGPLKPCVEDSYVNTSQGGLSRTGGRLDLALDSVGYFVISGPWGEGYTRDGRFRLDSEGRLLTASGNFPVIGQGGPIIVSQIGEVEFTQNGELRVDGNLVDRLRIVQPDKQQSFDNLNGTIFKLKGSGASLTDVENPRVMQGFIETSNVNIVEQMMEMIETEKNYNLNTKIISSRDANLSRAMDLGRPTQ